MTFKVKDGIAIGTTNIFNNSGQLLVNAPTANALFTTVNIRATGDVTANVYSDLGSNTSAAFTLANSGVAAGTYGSTSSTPIITVDAKGRITSAANAFIAIGSSVLTINGDSGTDTVTLGVDPLFVLGGTGISSTVSANTVTLDIDNTVALRADTHYIGNTAVTLNRAQNNLALTGISSISLPGSTSGTTVIQPTAAAGTTTITFPAITGTVITNADVATVTSAMIANSTIVDVDISSSAAIAVSKLAASTISGVTLGGSLNALTIGTGLTGTSYNGTYANTIAIDATVTTNTNTQTLTNKTLANAVHTGTTTTFTDVTNATSSTSAPVTFSGGVGIAKDIFIGGNLSISGNVFLSGNTTTISSNNLVIDDTIIYLANNNPADLSDIGFVGHFVGGTYQHTGLVRDASDSGIWKLFSNVTTEATNTISFGDVTTRYDTLQVGSLISTSANGTAPLTVASTTLVTNLNSQLLNGQIGSYYTSLSTVANTNALSAFAQANTALTVGQSAFAQANNEPIAKVAYAAANTANVNALSAFAQANTALTVGQSAFAQANNEPIAKSAFAAANNAYTAGNLSGTIPSTVLGNSSLNIGTTSIALNRASAAQALSGISIDGTAGSANNITGGAANNILYQSAAATTAKLTNNITTTKNFLSQTGDATNGLAPVWSTVTKTDVGLSVVENTALSTWAGSTNITTLGIISSGTWSGANVAVTKGGTNASDAPTARTNLGVAIGSNVQAWSANLDAIVATTTNGFLKRTGAATWAIDTNTYLTAEADTLQTVTSRGNTTANTINFTNATDVSVLGTAALIASGGISVAKSILVAGDIVSSNTTGTIISKDTSIQYPIATVTQTIIDSWPIATFRSAKYLVQISQGGSAWQVSEILVIHNGTTTFMTEFAAIETGGTALATFTSSVTGPGTTANLLVTMGSATTATINIRRTALVV